MSLEVIGTGLPRTGTYTLKHALEHLGYGPCYHMFDLVWKHPKDIDLFKAAENGEVSWAHLFESYKSAVDFPTARYYRELFRTFPKAKFIHTTRDPEEWYSSLVDTIFAENSSWIKRRRLLIKSVLFPSTRRRLRAIRINKKLLSEYLGGDIKDKQLTIKHFLEHEKEVKRLIPAEQLLIYTPTEGWPSLAKFLSKPVPTEKFPHLNSREKFLEREHTRLKPRIVPAS